MKTGLEKDLEEVEKLIKQKKQLLKKDSNNLVLQFELEHLNKVWTTLIKIQCLNRMNGEMW